MLRPAPGRRCEYCGAITRNAELAVLIRHLAAELHAADRTHPKAAAFSSCSHPTCRKVRAILQEHETHEH